MIRRFAKVSHLALAVSIGMGSYAPSAVAQEVANQSGESEAETRAADDGAIVVTARRREESLINVPIAVTAFSGEALERQGALDITEIGDTTPNVTLETSRGTNTTLSAFIRGVGQQDPVGGFEAGVGLYLDDVYLNRPQAAVLDIYDVERVEVLRGPQGTLYGRNTIGGAIKYVTRRLDDEPTLRARAVVGTYDQADAVITASAPVHDIVRVGGSIARLSRGGFGDNLTTGLENYNKDIWAGRGTLEFGGYGEPVLVRITGDYTKDKSNPRGGHRLIPGLQSGAPVLDNVFDTRGGLNDPEQDIEAYGAAMNISIDMSDALTFRSISAWRKDESATPIDFDALPAVDLDVPAVYNNKQFSQELQVLIESGALNGLVGAYYLDANSETIFDVRLPNTVTALTFGDVDTETTAVFADFTYDVTRQLSVSVGGRYTWDERSSDILRQVFIGGGSPFFGGTGIPIILQSDFEGTADFKEFTPRASVSFKPTDDHNVYASYSKGFKGGGFDPRGVSTACRTPQGAVCNREQLVDFMSFGPETVDSYEIGWKAQLFDRRLQFALAAFHADYTDVQVPGSVGVVLNGQQTFIGVTTNAGKARFRGLELEGNAALMRDFEGGNSLNFSWSLGYLDAEYLEFIDARGIDVADRRAIQNTPKWTASGTVNYGMSLGTGDLNFISTLSYRSASQQFELRVPGLDQGAYALWDANLVWNSGDDRWTIGLHGKNLTNKRYVTSGYNFLFQNPDTGEFVGNGVGAGPPAGVPGFDPTLGAEGVLTAYYGNPRQVFVSAAVRF